MNCTKVLQVFGGRPISSPVMPVDLAMRLCLSQSPPFCRFFSSYEELRGMGVPSLKPLRPCLNPKVNQQPPESLSWEDHQKAPENENSKKKRVVFADSKGLSLTAVRFYSEKEEDRFDLPLSPSDFWLDDHKQDLVEKPPKTLILGFSPPSADYVAFRSRLHQNCVGLESCSIHERSINGTVKVLNMCFEKAVFIRITFDSWGSFRDIPCVYMHHGYGGADTDTFTFDIALPDLNPKERIEFCIAFSAGQQIFWDNNAGQNFKVVWAGSVPEANCTRNVRKVNPVGQALGKAGNKLKKLEPLVGSRAASEFLLRQLQQWSKIGNVSPYW
ncbi:protein phosphatase 1 regulatory subunit 3C-B-like [Polypterus senegalus]|uniref:protein phosphatase 1 regulatory subunit 3C-B-like n=1 Tax=Polypterus senegalus TaxID=55291 RepID=UPI001965B8F0|nr:protein phosphatase 1 regulatory subunit 3C-B-like [Polypterus senegalus]